MERKEAIIKLNELIGMELHDLANKYNVTIYRNGKVNKGWAGHVFERHLELPINSAQSPNFGSWELKSIPLKKLKNGQWTVKETMAITMIDPINIMQKEFEDSHLLSKLKKAVIVVRTVGESFEDPSYIHSIVQYNLEGEAYQIIKNDYNIVRDTLLNNIDGFNMLTGRMGKYVQPRTKGSGHGSTSRAFYARASFLKQIIL